MVATYLVPKFPTLQDAPEPFERASVKVNGKRSQPHKVLRESQIEARLVKRVKDMGGEVRKVKWIGRSGAPDRIVMLPSRVDPYWGDGRRPEQTIWVELKAPGHKAAPHQIREHERMRKMGQRVEVVDSYERIDEILNV